MMDLIEEIKKRTGSSLLAFPKPKELLIKDLTELESYAAKLERSTILYELYKELGL